MSTPIRTAMLALALTALTGVGACGGGGGGGGGAGGGGGSSSDASLLSLTVSAGTLSPAFAPTVTAYSVVPALLHALVQVTPTAQAAGATISVNGYPVASGVASVQVPLGLGTTPVTVVVTAPDATTTRTTTVVFTRKRSALGGLAASAGTLAPVFGPAQLSYSVLVALTTTSTTVTPTAVDPAATIKVNTVTTASGTPSSAIALPPGLTPVTIEVTAGDGITMTTYTVVFNRTLTDQQAYLKASNTGTGDAFGRSVAVSGDTLVVGACFEYSSATGVDGDQADNGARDSGAAYVFVRNGATWSQQAYLKASNTGVSA